MQNQEATKFEFILKLENNIVIQRFFNVNHYNPAAKNSMDLYYIVSEICDEIASDLKDKTLDILAASADYITPDQRADDRTKYKEEYFILQIKRGNDVFISRIFPAQYYHPKARYAVDIRPKVRKILGDVTNVLSSRNLIKSYLDYELR
jgi:hypothetical protein